MFSHARVMVIGVGSDLKVGRKSECPLLYSHAIINLLTINYYTKEYTKHIYWKICKLNMRRSRACGQGSVPFPG